MRLFRLMPMLVMLSLTSAALSAADLTGKWTIDGDVAGNPVNMECTVTQAADAKITGKCLLNGSEQTEIEGAAKDATFKFSFTVQGYTLTYTGTLDGETISGDIDVAGTTGKFSGKRG